MPPHEGHVPLRLLPLLLAGALFVVPAARAGSGPDAAPAGASLAPDPYPARAPAPRPAVVRPRIVVPEHPTTSVPSTAPVAPVRAVTRPARPSTPPARRHAVRRPPAKPAAVPVRDVVPLTVDVAAGLGSLRRVEPSTGAAAVALLLAAITAASGAALVLATRRIP